MLTDHQHLERIRGDADIHAFVAFSEGRRPGFRPGGPLDGLSLAVKDMIAVAGLPQTAGMPLFAERRAERDAPAVAALERAGAWLVGVTVSDAAGFGTMTPSVGNPRWPGRAVGGSSGGAAAALAAGLADIGLGTDTGGSVRIPAAYCGLWALKPSHGRVSVDGVIPLAPSLDHVGPMARDWPTLARAGSVLFGEDITALPPLPVRRIGFDRARCERTDPPVRAAIGRIVAALTAQGIEMVPVTLPDRRRLTVTHGMIVAAESYAFYRQMWHPGAAAFSPAADASLRFGAKLTAADEAAARRTAASARAAIDAILDEVDVVLAPTLAVFPLPRRAETAVVDSRIVSATYANIAEAVPFSVAGVPTVAMPVPDPAFPVGCSVQVAGSRGSDLAVLRQARFIFGALDHATSRVV